MKESTGWALVGTQFGVLAALLFLPAGQLWSRSVTTGVVAGVLIVFGVAIALAAGRGLGSALTPLPIPRTDGQLVTTGVFRYVRHPIYSGLLLIGAGLAAWGASWVHLLAWGLLWLVLITKARFEEKLLAERYPEYQAYCAKTGRFAPRVSR